MTLVTVIAVVASYLLGAVPFAYLVARVAEGVDVRTVGSGNVGATNVLRVAGVGSALAVTALDVTKGAAAALLGLMTGGGPLVAMACGAAAVAGHIFPVWLRFHGGKGVATACGVFAVLAPLAALLSVGAFVVTAWWTRYVSLGSVVGMATLTATAWWTTRDPAVTSGAALVAVTVVLSHRENLARLWTGTERRLGGDD